MSFTTFRITTQTCMACGHEQRCKIRLVDDVEQPVECYSCGQSDSWMSLPVISAQRIEMDHAVETHNPLTRSFTEIFGEQIDYDVAAIGYMGIATDIAATTLDLDALSRFFRSQGIEVEFQFGDEENDDDD